MNKLYSAEEKRTLLTIFRKHNDDLRPLIGIEYEKRTVSRYDSCCRYMEDMIKRVYGKDVVTLAEVNGELVRNYEMHLKVVRGCQASTVTRYMKCFKKVIHMALANEWMTKDPFVGIHFSAKPVNKDYLFTPIDMPPFERQYVRKPKAAGVKSKEKHIHIFPGTVLPHKWIKSDEFL